MDRDQDAAFNCGQFARLCVFCGSSSGKKAVYTEAAVELGTELVRRGIDLVYGGGSIGLMGTVAEAALDAGGHVVGYNARLCLLRNLPALQYSFLSVIPKALMPKEICGATVGDLVAVDDMHQRKAEMARLADAFIALPGGFGTFEEVLEIITWAQLGIHKKPVGLLNVDGYFDAMLTLFDKALDEGFLNEASHNIVVSAPTAAELLDKLKSYAPTVDKSVPELTWKSIGKSAPSSPKTDPEVKGDCTIHDSHFHLNSHRSRASGTQAGYQAPNTTQRIRITKLDITNSIARSSYLVTGSRKLVRRPQFQSSPLARAGRFSVHSHTSPVDCRSSHGSNTVAMKIVDCRFRGASLGARVVTMFP